MSALARRMARWLWWWMLWFMRRPWMKRLQRGSSSLFPERMREQAAQSMVRQNRFARRIGLPMLIVSFNLLLASCALTICFMSALRLYESGVLTVPDEIRERVEH